MNFFQKISVVWQNVSLVQRALLIAIVLTLVIVGSLLTVWVRRPEMRVLYSGLEPEEAAKITEKISESDIAYELKNGGTTIYVAREKVAQLRLDMAKEGLPEGGQKGYRIFDNEKIGVSPVVQDMNLKRALQEELAKSIQMLNGVIHCRIHIVSTKQSIFASKTSDTSASVVLRLRAGFRLSASNIAAITHLVAGGVEGLEPDKVTVIDSQGRLLSRTSENEMDQGAGSVADYRERVEQNLAKKAEDMLSAVLGPGRAAVRVRAEINMTSVNTVTETPIEGVPRREEIKSTTETKAGSMSAEDNKVIPGGGKEDETAITEFQPGRTVEQKVELAGEIISLKVAAFVDLSAADTNEADSGGEVAKIMGLSDVGEIIKNAIGLKSTDLLKVVDVKFNRPLESLADEELSGGLDYIAIAGQASVGIAAICALLVFRMFGGAKKKAAPASGTEQLAEGQGPAGLLPAGTEDDEPLMLRKHIAGTLQENPEQAKQLFASWIEEKV